MSQTRNKAGNSEKDYGSQFAADLFVVEYFGSNLTCIAIGNAWRFLVFKVWGILLWMDGRLTFEETAISARLANVLCYGLLAYR